MVATRIWVATFEAGASIFVTVITKKDLFMTTYSMNHLSGDGKWVV